MQTIKHFLFGKYTGPGVTESCNIPLEEQIDEYLKQHPDHSVASLSTIIASTYKEAFVVFNVRGENQKPYNNKKQDKS